MQKKKEKCICIPPPLPLYAMKAQEFDEASFLSMPYNWSHSMPYAMCQKRYRASVLERCNDRIHHTAL